MTKLFNFATLLFAAIQIPGLDDPQTDQGVKDLITNLLTIGQYVGYILFGVCVIVSLVIIGIAGAKTIAGAGGKKEGVWQELSTTLKVVIITLIVVGAASVIVGIVCSILSGIGWVPAPPKGV
jgi:hypothetical protein